MLACERASGVVNFTRKSIRNTLLLGLVWFLYSGVLAICGIKVLKNILLFFSPPSYVENEL